MFAQKVLDLMKQKKITKKKLSKEIGIGINQLKYWEDNDTTPNADVVARIAKYLNVSINYLIGNEDLKSYTPDNILPLHTKRIPLLGDIACGEPIFADEENGNYVVTSDEIEADFCLRAKGDSMVGARILDGDIVFIRSQPEVENGQIAAVIINDEATLKRVYYYPEQQKLILTPENPLYEPRSFIGNELSQVRILGKAIAFQSIVR